jgi:hypothetical protein
LAAAATVKALKMAQIEIAIVPTKRQWDFITCPADLILFGGGRGGAKTSGSLLEFWDHAIEHGPNALGLMVRKQRTDLKDTQLAAMNMYGNAAEWKGHGGDVRLSFQATRIVALLISDERFRHGFPLCHGIQTVEINLACRTL